MNKPKYSTGVFICLMIFYSTRLAWPQSESEPSSNPFAAILQAAGSTQQNFKETSNPSYKPPELCAQTITLDNVDANNVVTAFQCMSSDYGIIRNFPKTNSLLIIDTQENIDTITSEIKKIDKPIPGLLVCAVNLKFLDAESVKTALLGMCSKHGTITTVEKANSLIISDTSESLQVILNEIDKIDKLIPGLIVEAVTLKFIDAKSAITALEKMSSEHGTITVIERTNSLIICDRKENLDAIRAEIAKIDKATSGLFVKTITLKFLEAKNLKNVLDKMVSEYGSIATNEKSNSLIICDTKENLEKILTEVREADQTPQQIVVEVVILDVQLKDDTELGINWDSDISASFGVDYEQNFGTGTEPDSSVVSLTGIGGISNVIHIIQQKRDAQILASPRAMMLSGQSATIEAVEEIPYREIMDTAQGGAAALTSTQFKDVGVTLKVTATVTDGNDIFLIVDTTHNVKTGQSESGVPVVDTRRANTSLLLKDGQIVVMGGLRRSENIEQIYQIPILGDMPILGGLFKDTNIVKYNSELVVLLSPSIYKGEPPPHEVISIYDEIVKRPMFPVKPEKQRSIQQNNE